LEEDRADGQYRIIAPEPSMHHRVIDDVSQCLDQSPNFICWLSKPTDPLESLYIELLNVQQLMQDVSWRCRLLVFDQWRDFVEEFGRTTQALVTHEVHLASCLVNPIQ
jgi:hypothetical protein